MASRGDRPPRWPIWLIAVGLVGAFSALVFARYREGRDFVLGLQALGAALGIAACGVALTALRRRLSQPGFIGWAAIWVAAPAIAVQRYLGGEAPPPSSGPPQIQMSAEVLSGLPAGLAIVALFLGAAALQAWVAAPPGAVKGWRPWARVAAAVLGVSAALYVLGPVLRGLGVPLNHWTFLGLIGLGALAFGLTSTLRRVTGS